MKTITKIIRAKDKDKKLELPREFLDKDIRITIEEIVFENEDNNINKKNFDDLEKFKQLINKKRIEIPQDMNIDRIMNEMNNGLL